jgi:hypothetical protein
MAHVLIPGFPFVGLIMAKINFDAATKGNPGISTCAIVIKEDEQHYIFAIISLLSIQYLVKVTITVIQNMLGNPLKNTHHLNK